jgi:hypothetical protein
MNTAAEPFHNNQTSSQSRSFKATMLFLKIHNSSYGQELSSYHAQGYQNFQNARCAVPGVTKGEYMTVDLH